MGGFYYQFCRLAIRLLIFIARLSVQSYWLQRAIAGDKTPTQPLETDEVVTEAGAWLEKYK